LRLQAPVIIIKAQTILPIDQFMFCIFLKSFFIFKLFLLQAGITALLCNLTVTLKAPKDIMSDFTDMI
jgi:hypothetical protein